MGPHSCSKPSEVSEVAELQRRAEKWWAQHRQLQQQQQQQEEGAQSSQQYSQRQRRSFESLQGAVAAPVAQAVQGAAQQGSAVHGEALGTEEPAPRSFRSLDIGDQTVRVCLYDLKCCSNPSQRCQDCTAQMPC